MVVRLEPDRTWSTITLQKEPVRLGEGEFGARERPAAGGHGPRDARVPQLRRAGALARRRRRWSRSPRPPPARPPTRPPSCGGCARRRASTCTSCRARRRPASSSSESSAACTSVSGARWSSTSAAEAPRSRSATVRGAEHLDSLRLGAIRLTGEFPEVVRRRPGRRQGVRSHAPPGAGGGGAHPQASSPASASTSCSARPARSATSRASSSGRCAATRRSAWTR